MKTCFYKILILMILLSVIAGGLVLTVNIIGQTKFIEKSIIQENKLLAELTAYTIESGYIKNQYPFETLKRVSDSKNVLFLWIVKPNGKIFLSNDPNIIGNKINDTSLGTKNIVIKDILFYKDNKKIKLIIYPLNIQESGKQWALYLGVSLEPIKIARDRMIISSFISFVIIIVVAVLLSFYLAKDFVKPLKQLTEAVDKISMGDMDIKINIKSEDEIGKLATSFRRMINSIKLLMKVYNKRQKNK